MTPEQIEQALKAVDHAAKQNDRYLLIAFAIVVLVLMVVAFAWVVKWLKALVSEVREDGKNFALVVVANTQAFERHSAKLNEQSNLIDNLAQEVRRRP